MKTTVGGVLLVLIAGSVPNVRSQNNYTDVDILNFALNLECLEAEFYSWVAYGRGIASVDSTLIGSNSKLTANSSGASAGALATGSSADPEALAIAIEIAENEIEHVRYLRKALGSSAVACPALGLDAATFTTAAQAALTAAIPGATITPGQTFDPYGSSTAFYLGAFIFEDVGVTAYKGAIGALESQAYAAAAAGILALEAGHAAVIRNQLYAVDTNTALTYTPSGAAAGATPTALTVGAAADAIVALRNNLGGTTGSNSTENALERTMIAQGNQTAAPGPDLFAADSDGVAYTRTPSQVLKIVQFGSDSKPGGFFPQGPTGNSDVLQITGTGTRTCSSGALSTASISLASAAVMAVALAAGL